MNSRFGRSTYFHFRTILPFLVTIFTKSSHARLLQFRENKLVKEEGEDPNNGEEKDSVDVLVETELENEEPNKFEENGEATLPKEVKPEDEEPNKFEENGEVILPEEAEFEEKDPNKVAVAVETEPEDEDTKTVLLVAETELEVAYTNKFEAVVKPELDDDAPNKLDAPNGDVAALVEATPNRGEEAAVVAVDAEEAEVAGEDPEADNPDPKEGAVVDEPEAKASPPNSEAEGVPKVDDVKDKKLGFKEEGMKENPNGNEGEVEEDDAKENGDFIFFFFFFQIFLIYFFIFLIHYFFSQISTRALHRPTLLVIITKANM